MSLTLRTDFGCTEAIIDDDCGLKDFMKWPTFSPKTLRSASRKNRMTFDTLHLELPVQRPYLNPVLQHLHRHFPLPLSNFAKRRAKTMTL